MSEFESAPPAGAAPDPASSGGDSPGDVLRLFPYQAKVLSRLLRHDQHALVEQPMGAGKTIIVKALVACGIGQNFTHALIAAPQQQIERSFVGASPRWIEWPEGLAAQPRLELPPGLIEAARTSGSGSRRHIRRYLRAGRPGFALACTHSALTVLGAKDLIDSLGGYTLIIDEAHHAPAPELARFINMWIERGGRVVSFTATPYRADAQPVLLPGMLHHRRSISEHMAAGFAPRHLESEIVALGGHDDHVTGAQLRGEVSPPGSYRKELIDSIVQHWVSDGRPKTIVRIPPARGGSGSLVAELVRAFDAKKARVLDATGIHSSDKARFIDALEAERTRTYETSEFDVIIGIQRVHEGSDWKHCSVAYCVGIPASITTAVQFIGRTLRLKPTTYPMPYRDLSRVVFFVPSAGGRSLDLLSLDHSRHALLVSTFMSDHKTGHEWIVSRAVKQGIESGLGKIDENALAEKAEEESSEPIDQRVRAELELALVSAREEILAMGGEEPTTETILEHVRTDRPDLPEGALVQIAVEILAAQPGEEGHSVQRRISRLVARHLRIDPQIKKAFREAFATVLTEFRKTTLERSPVLEEVGRQIHALTGRDALHFARRLRDAAPRPVTIEQILSWADAHFDENGEWPVAGSGPVLGAPDENWGAIDSALRLGLRGLPGGSSLARLLSAERAVKNRLDRPKLDVKTILAHADAWKGATGDWPTRDSGNVPGTDDTWTAIDLALHRGGRGIAEGGSSLARLLEAERGARNIRTLPKLTVKQVLKWADEHFERTGAWPTHESGQIPGAPDGETWACVAAACEHGLRGLPMHTSFFALLRDERGAEGKRATERKLTEERVLALLKNYNQRHPGEWPAETTKDPDLREKHDLTWRMIDRALAEGRRGMKGGSSIVKFLQQKFGVRNSNRPGPITEDVIWRWALEHRARTGRWPARGSGDVHGHPGEKWVNLHSALVSGTRGLPGGETLKQFLQRRARRRRAS